VPLHAWSIARGLVLCDHRCAAEHCGMQTYLLDVINVGGNMRA